MNQWRINALRTWHDDNVPRDVQLAHAALGLAGETGELVDMIKKHIYKPGYFVYSVNIADELGDVLYYAIIVAHLFNLDLDDVANGLWTKLADGHGWEGSAEKIGY